MLSEGAHCTCTLHIRMYRRILNFHVLFRCFNRISHYSLARRLICDLWHTMEFMLCRAQSANLLIIRIYLLSHFPMVAGEIPRIKKFPLLSTIMELKFIIITLYGRHIFVRQPFTQEGKHTISNCSSLNRNAMESKNMCEVQIPKQRVIESENKIKCRSELTQSK